MIFQGGAYRTNLLNVTTCRSHYFTVALLAGSPSGGTLWPHIGGALWLHISGASWSHIGGTFTGAI
jgi:hypothetical protein